MTARFPKRARLSTKADFRAVFERPVKSRDDFFTILVRSNGLAHSRLGLAVSRKTASAAVERNRIKRLVRESFRHHHLDLPRIDVVVISRTGLVGQTNSVLVASLEQHWHRLIRRCRKAQS